MPEWLEWKKAVDQTEQRACLDRFVEKLSAKSARWKAKGYSFQQRLLFAGSYTILWLEPYAARLAFTRYFKRIKEAVK